MDFLKLKNGGTARLSRIPRYEFPEFRKGLLEALPGKRISAYFASPAGNGIFTLYAVLTDPVEHRLEVAASTVGSSCESLAKDAPAFHWFERELFEQYGIRPEGHPWLKPIRFQNRMVPGGPSRPEPGVTDYFTMSGSAAHEVAVGPVHAGVIEPGHFRFQCMGEDVYSLEIELGYQHRGIESMLIGGPDLKTPHLIETASGDTSASSALCCARILEGFAGGYEISPRSEALRTIALELERIANHTGDLGALAGDVAFLTTASYCGRIRGEFLNMTARLCGNRFGRGFILPGGVAFDLTGEDVAMLLPWFDRTRRDLERALELMFDSPGVLDRFENTGTVSRENAAKIGMTGVAGRASGLRFDARIDLPYGNYPEMNLNLPEPGTGDVFARALIRRRELSESLRMVRSLLEALPDGDVGSGTFRPEPNSIAVSVAEAWRGELCHVALTDDAGRFSRYKIVDPSFHNWYGLALALRNEQISNFPICNKSFNLSYCGHDL